MRASDRADAPLSIRRDPVEAEAPVIEEDVPLDEQVITEVFDRARDREEDDEGEDDRRDQKRIKVINILEARFGLDDDLEEIDEIIQATDSWIEEIRNEGFDDEFDDETERGVG